MMRNTVLTVVALLLVVVPLVAYPAPCSKEFVDVANNRGSLGCLQQDIVRRSGRPYQLDWFKASDYCFDNYGGRLPSAGEFTIAGLNVAMKSPTAPVWTTDFFFNSAAESAITGKALPGPAANPIVIDLGYAQRTQNQVFRCWVPPR